jgi:hypothetical protein
MRRILTALFAVALVGPGGSAQASVGHGHGGQPPPPVVSTFATGFNNPRGLTFGPDGDMYVAEGGLGGTNSTVGQWHPGVGRGRSVHRQHQ